MGAIFGVWHRDGRPVTGASLAPLDARLAHCGSTQSLLVRSPIGLGARHADDIPAEPVEDTGGILVAVVGRLDDRQDLLRLLSLTVPLHDLTDAALVAAAYRRFGTGLAGHLSGEFALALFDPALQQLILARDGIGTCPLYFALTPHTVAVASEAKAVAACPDIGCQPDEDVLADIALNDLVGAAHEGRTCFRGVLAVRPAHVRVITRSGDTEKRYWDFSPEAEDRHRTFDEYAEDLRARFTRAVRRRSGGPRPVAVSVSGGLDSSSIFCAAELARREEGATRPPVLPFSYLSRPGSGSDEREFLLEIERQYGVAIERLEHVPPGLMHRAAEGVWHAESPLHDQQWNVTTMLLSQAHARGARRLMFGHWGDQVLFDLSYLVDMVRQGRARTAWAHARSYPRWVSTDPDVFTKDLVRGALLSFVPEGLARSLGAWKRRLASQIPASPWYTQAFRRRASEASAHRWRPPAGLSLHAQSLYSNVRSPYMVHSMEWNHRVAAMHGLEVSFPFLDRDLVSLLMFMPGEIMTRDGVPKAVFRKAMEGILPARIAQRASKADFTDRANESVLADQPQALDILCGVGMAGRMGWVDTQELRRQVEQDRQRSGLGDSRASRRLCRLVGLELMAQGFARA